MTTPLPYLRRLWFDLYGRSPRAHELRMAEGMDVEPLVASMVRRPEFFAWWYEEELYYFLLLDNFRPRTENTEQIPARLAAGRMTIRDAMQEIVISTGFSQRNPGPDTFVTVVLEQLLGVTVQKDPRLLEAGKKMYDGYPSLLFKEKGQSQADLVAITMRQPGFASFTIQRHLSRLLATKIDGKAAHAGILDAAAARFRERPDEFPEVIADIALTEPYRKGVAQPREKTDHQFLRGLYIDLLDRVPDQEELRRLRNALQALADSRPIRSVLVRMILAAGKRPSLPGAGSEPAAQVVEMFLRFLGRRPGQAEADTFVSMLQQGPGNAELAARALLTSPEYQYY